MYLDTVTAVDIVACAINIVGMLAALAGLLWILAIHKADDAHADHEARVWRTAEYLRLNPRSISEGPPGGSVRYLGPEDADSFHACRCSPCARGRKDRELAAARERREAGRAAAQEASDADRRLPRAVVISSRVTP